MEVLVAPWRYDYVTGKIGRSEGCPFCDLKAEDCLFYGQHCAVVMNAYPYATGHVMVVPLRHTSDLLDLTDEEHKEFFDLTRRALKALRAAFGPQGVNMGINLGEAAGAGVATHLHCHLVPRWQGDHNFMQVAAGTSVLPMTVEAAFEALKKVWQ